MMRAMAKRQRKMGNQLANSEFQIWIKRLIGDVYDCIKDQPILIGIARFLMKPFPKLTTRLYWLATRKGLITNISKRSIRNQVVPDHIPVSARPLLFCLKRATDSWSESA
jgi:hypothetical protein